MEDGRGQATQSATECRWLPTTEREVQQAPASMRPTSRPLTRAGGDGQGQSCHGDQNPPCEGQALSALTLRQMPQSCANSACSRSLTAQRPGPQRQICRPLAAGGQAAATMSQDVLAVPSARILAFKCARCAVLCRMPAPVRQAGSDAACPPPRSHVMSSSDGDVSTASDKARLASPDGDVTTESDGHQNQRGPPGARAARAVASGVSRPLAAARAPAFGVSRPAAAGQAPLSDRPRAEHCQLDGEAVVVAPPLVTGLQPLPARCLSAAMRVVPLGVDLTANVRSRAREEVQRDLMHRSALCLTGARSRCAWQAARSLKLKL